MTKKRMIIFICLVLAVSLSGCSITKKKRVAADVNADQMRSICELSTMKCYYHNTAKFDSSKKVLLWNTNKELWIEYEAIVNVGVDAKNLNMDVKDNTITITMPHATVLDCKVDETSLSEDSYMVDTNGLFAGSIDHEDQAEAFEKAQATTEEEAKNDEDLLKKAEERAQELLSSYVKNIGEAVDKDYVIEWNIADEN